VRAKDAQRNERSAAAMVQGQTFAQGAGTLSPWKGGAPVREEQPLRMTSPAERAARVRQLEEATRRDGRRSKRVEELNKKLRKADRKLEEATEELGEERTKLEGKSAKETRKADHKRAKIRRDYAKKRGEAQRKGDRKKLARYAQEEAEKLAKVDRKLAEKLADHRRDLQDEQRDVAKRQRERQAIVDERDALVKARGGPSPEVRALQATLDSSRLYVPADKAAPTDPAQYRLYLADALGVKPAAISADFARFARGLEDKAAGDATRGLRVLLPDGAINSRDDARAYFDDIQAGIGTLQRGAAERAAHRARWEETNEQPWALEQEPGLMASLKDYSARGGTFDRDSPLARHFATRAENNIKGEVSDTVYRQYATSLNGLSPDRYGDEQRLEDVFEHAQYASYLGHKAVKTADKEARARVHEFLANHKAGVDAYLTMRSVWDSFK